MLSRKESLIVGFNGKRIYPFNLTNDQIDINNISHCLSMLCRWSGHIPRFYCVADHCVQVSLIIEEMGGSVEEQLQGLLHDASEHICQDIASPIKRHLPEYKEFEESVQSAIAKAFDLEYPFANIVHEADLKSLLNEAQAFEKFGISHEFDELIRSNIFTNRISSHKTWPGNVNENTPNYSCNLFMRHYLHLLAELSK